MSDIHTIGSGGPHVVIVGSQHGDEPLGRDVIMRIRESIADVRGTLTTIIAHPKAIEQKVRYIETDLNRSFPGSQSGTTEEQIAHQLAPIIQSADVVIDLHTTRSHMDRIQIITDRNEHIDTVLAMTDITRVAYFDPSGFGKGGLITIARAGVSFEYYIDRPNNIDVAYDDCITILKGCGIISGDVERHTHKELYTVTGTYEVPEGCMPSDNLTNYTQVEVGEVIGTVDGKPLHSDTTFYPLFVGNGRYNGTIAIMAEREQIEIIDES